MLLVYLSALIDVVPVFPENTVNISGQPDWLVNSSVVAQVSLFLLFLLSVIITISALYTCTAHIISIVL